ncbi:MAG TPA: hypothetical protein VGC56_11800 [Allosphingosinicella sp.]
MLWALTLILIVEMALVHLLLSRWSGAAALALGLVSGLALVSVVALILSFRSRPVVLGPDGLRVRAGFLIDAHVPLDEIAFAQSGFAPADYMPGGLLKASLLNAPNIVVLLRGDIDLPGPFGKSRHVHAVALALDEPARFLAAIETVVKAAAAEDRSALAAA